MSNRSVLIPILSLLAATLAFGSSHAIGAAASPPAKSLDAALFAQGGSSDSRSTFTSEGALAYRFKPALILQSAGMASRTSALRQLGYSAGLGYEPSRVGVFVFTDGLSYKLDPYKQTNHMQLRPVVRYKMDRLTWSAFYAIDLTGRKQITDQRTADYLTEDASGVFRIQEGFRLFNKGLSHGGAELSAIPAPWAMLTARGRVAQGGTYDLTVRGEALAWRGLVANAQATKTKVKGDQRVTQSFWSMTAGLGWRFGVGRSEFSKLSHRLLVSPDFPLVVQEREEWSTKDRIANALGVTAQCTPSSGRSPLNVECSASPTGGVEPYRYAWTFGDGTPGSAETAPKHVYTAVGTKIWTVTVTDALNISKSASGTVVVDYALLSATCTLTPTSGTMPLTVTGSCSVSGGTGSYTYNWTWGDGTTSSSPSAAYTATSGSFSHTYTSAGPFSVQLVLASGSQSQSFNWGITVTPPPNSDPTVTCAMTATGPTVVKPLVTVTCTYNDADGDVGSWMASLSEVPFPTGVLSSYSGSGIAAGAGFSFDYTMFGLATATITVNVDDGRGGTGSTTLTVSPPEPTIIRQGGQSRKIT